MLKQKLQEPGSEKQCPIAVIVREGKILLGHRHYKKSNGGWKDVSVWTAPGGRCDPGETIEEALRREVVEEVGITDMKITDFIGIVPGAKKGDEVPIFLCVINKDPQLMEPEKFSEWRWFAVDEYAQGVPEDYINETSREMIADFLVGSE